jgi:hypothetical protein
VEMGSTHNNTTGLRLWLLRFQVVHPYHLVLAERACPVACMRKSQGCKKTTVERFWRTVEV